MRASMLGKTAVALAIVGLCLPAAAEVRVRTDRHGGYQWTQVITGGSRLQPVSRVWSLVGRSTGQQALNPQGDRNGDLWPTIRESSLAPHHPWVVWSRNGAHGYDLAWSRWSPAGWEPVQWVHDRVLSVGDDLDADLTFDRDGRPFMTWWREEPRGGRVYITGFAYGNWTRPHPVTEPGEDAWQPVIELLADGGLLVTYETETGAVSQLVKFEEPVTITDDIDPVAHFRNEGQPVAASSAR